MVERPPDTPNNLVDVNYCVVCGSEAIDSVRWAGSRAVRLRAMTLVCCDNCNSRFRCNTSISSDPTTETRPRGDSDE